MKKVFFLYKVSLAILFLPLVIIVSSPLKLWGGGGAGGGGSCLWNLYKEGGHEKIAQK